MRMTSVLGEQGYDEGSIVTTVDSAYKKFLGKEVTYNIIVYELNPAALDDYSKDLEEIRGMSKSKAKAVAEDGVMTPIATAVIVLDEKSGSVISCDIS